MMSKYRLHDLLQDANESHEGWLRQFDALVLSKPTEILIWEGGDYEACSALSNGICTCGAESRQHWDGVNKWGDIEIFFPCIDPTHTECGYFWWTLNTSTREYWNRKRKGSAQRQSWDEIIIDVEKLTHENQIAAITDWIAKNIEPLARIPIRMATYEERRGRASHYAEWHIEKEPDLYVQLDKAWTEIKNGNIIMDDPEKDNK